MEIESGRWCFLWTKNRY